MADPILRAAEWQDVESTIWDMMTAKHREMRESGLTYIHGVMITWLSAGSAGPGLYQGQFAHLVNPRGFESNPVNLTPISSDSLPKWFSKETPVIFSANKAEIEALMEV